MENNLSPGLLEWDFPLPRCHTGIPLGNGRLGLLIWGDDQLYLTISRAGFWDRRGGRQFSTGTTYREVKRLVEARDEPGLDLRFAKSKTLKTYQIGGGRLEISIPGFRPVSARLILEKGEVEIDWESSEGRTLHHRAGISMEDEIAWIEGPNDQCRLQLIPAWDYLSETLSPLGIEPPMRHTDTDEEWFVQTLPADESLALGWRLRDNLLLIETAIASTVEEFTARPSRFDDGAALRQNSRNWWEAYWKSVPRLKLPDAELQHAYLLGVYKQAGLTTPGAPAATLQGPWMEETHLPPWSNDYHFNINVQLIYGPALATNRLSHFEPLWTMIREWLPVLQRNGESFFERDGALMLPHAVDDRCQIVGSFWTGIIDHACTAWMAQLAWLHYRYSLDESILRELAWPLLRGAFEGYSAMLEKVPESDGSWRYSMPLSVSPEYNGCSIEACGRDASFQLAALHCVTQILPQAAQILGEPLDPRWREVSEHLPPYTLIGEPPRIALWKDQDLAESHRHHSFLAAIWPFATVDPLAPEHWEIVGRTLRRWGSKGAGHWTGWCLPWSSILCTRCGLPDAAVAWLKWMLQVFTNEGHGTLHDPDFAGVGGSGRVGVLHRPGFQRAENFHEIMQMDAAMATVTAILELLVQSRGDTIHVLERLPKRWRDFTFSGIRTEGAFFVGADVIRGKVRSISVRAEKGGTLRLRHPLGDRAIVRKNEKSLPAPGPTLEVELAPGEEIVLAESGSIT